ncbi:MAG: PH domain-containing protein [Actinomycetes bacterium]
MTEPTPQPVQPRWRATSPRAVHPVTPFVKAVRVFPAFAAFFAFEGMGSARSLGPLGVGALLVAIVVATATVAWLQWSRFRFWFDDDGDLRVRSGVLQVNERRVQVSRLQSVDVTQPLVARLFGLAAVRPDVAGTGDKGTRIEYLAYDDAQHLRAELLARSAGLRMADGEDAPEAPERTVVTVPPGVLLESLVLQPVTIVTTVVAVSFITFAVVTGQWAALLPSMAIVAAPLFVVGGQFLTWFGFTVSESPDGLRLRYGLTEHRAQTVPPGRVQAVRIEAPVMWRHRGWVKVTVNVAGATGGDEAKQRPSTLIPVAPLELARSVIAQVLPGTDPLAVEVVAVPTRARWRSPLQHRRLATGSDDFVLVARHGWLVPTWDAVPHARTQSVRVTQGPWQRRLRLASVHVDSTPGPVRIKAAQRGAEEARFLAEAQSERARLARATAGPQRWMQPTEERQ